LFEATRLEILKRLKSDYRFKTDTGSVMRGGQCPECKGKELYVYTDKPWVVRCGRLNKCGREFATKELYADLFDNWSDRYRQTPDDPNAAAKAYLRDGRGLNVVKLTGAYTQELYKDWESEATSATVRFAMPCHYATDSRHNGQAGWWERIIDRPQRFGKKKANMPKGWKYGGHVWYHPALSIAELAAAREIWFAEGIFDAVALAEAFALGRPSALSVSTLSTNNYPEAFLAALADAATQAATGSGAGWHRPTLIFAFDPGKAGVGFTRKYVERARSEGWTCRAAQVTPDGEGEKRDWNDLHQHGRLTPENLETYLENGDITVAETAAEKAYLLFRRHRRASFPLTFKTRQLWASLSAQRISELVQAYDEDKTLASLTNEEKWEMAAREAVEISQIANCVFRALYYQANEEIKQYSYYLRIDFPGKQDSKKANFPGNVMLKEGGFTDHLISVTPGAIFDGSTYQLKHIMSQQLDGIRTVDALYFSGYSIQHKAWMFEDIAVSAGRVIDLNDEDFFEIGKRGVKPASLSGDFAINYDPHKVDYSWWDDFHAAFGPLGTVTLAYWFLSLFAEQVRFEQQRLGFLEIWGEPESGKSTLLIFLWKLVGRLMNYEGFDPASATAAGIARELVKYGNLPIVLLEGDRAAEANHNKKFDWNELKKLYNGHSPRTRGVANAGTDTFSPRFRGSLIIAQNHPIKEADQPVLERIMGLHVNKSRFTPRGKIASERIEAIEVADVSGWIIHMIRQEAQILEHYKARFKTHEARLNSHPEVVSTRLAFNHAQLASALDCLVKAMSVGGRQVISASEAELGQELITKMCVERHKVISSDHPIIAQFWENFDWLEMKMAESSHLLNWHRDKSKIAIHMTQFEQKSADFRINLPAGMVELKKLLPTSKSRKFVAQTTVNCVDEKARHCWVFEKPKAEAIIV
jgi:Toprim-like